MGGFRFGLSRNKRKMGEACWDILKGKAASCPSTDMAAGTSGHVDTVGEDYNKDQMTVKEYANPLWVEAAARERNAVSNIQCPF